MSKNDFSAAIFGCSGTVLTDEEKRFFEDVRPAGFILFSRNVDTPEQTAALVKSLRETTGNADAPVLIDQEGGRVQRLTEPHWKKRPAGNRFEKIYRDNADTGVEAAYLNARYIGATLSDLGINVDCLPLLDVPVAGANDVIGDRAFGKDVDIVSDLGAAVIEGLTDAGVMAVIKHIPGHGRATADSHLELPVVDTDRATLEKTDFVPFKRLSSALWAMTAHVMYTAIDAENPASLSQKVIRDVIRGFIGFDGFLICDDLSMKALKGDFASLTKRALDAGCDAVLHCNGRMDEMRAVASALPPLTDKSAERLAVSFEKLKKTAQRASVKEPGKMLAFVDGLLGA